jgi:hypothetical protein
MTITQLLLAAALAALALLCLAAPATAQDIPAEVAATDDGAEAGAQAAAAPQMLILRSPLPQRPPDDPSHAPGTYPAPTCPGDDTKPPDFERLANGERHSRIGHAAARL